jgi:hypothetical protein
MPGFLLLWGAARAVHGLFESGGIPVLWRI